MFIVMAWGLDRKCVPPFHVKLIFCLYIMLFRIIFFHLKLFIFLTSELMYSLRR
jgi:hypothetical protein